MLSPPLQPGDEFRDARALVVLVQRDERPLEAELAQQASAVARVLGGDGGCPGENLARTRRNVAQLPIGVATT